MITEKLRKQISDFADENREQFIKDLKDLVEIPSISQNGDEKDPYGTDCSKVLAVMLDKASECGLDTVNDANRYGLAYYGSGPHSIGIFSHLDVVETDDLWVFPPFTVTEKDGWLFGRGVADDKCGAVIGLYTVKALQALHIPFQNRLVLYYGLNEEKGMKDLDYYISRNKQPDFTMVPDFKFPVSIGEAGSLKVKMKLSALSEEFSEFTAGFPGRRFLLNASVLYHGEKQLQEKEDIRLKREKNGIRISAEGKSDTRYGAGDSISALYVLCDYLISNKLGNESDQLSFARMKEISLCKDGSLYNLAVQDDLFGKLKTNCLLAGESEDGTDLELRITYPFGLNDKEIMEHLMAYSDEITVVEMSHSEPYLFPAEDPRTGILVDTWNRVSGRNDSPCVGGGTYARKLNNAVSYGPKDHLRCSFLPHGHGEIHCPDETRHISTLLNALKVYIEAVIELDEYYGVQTEL